MVRLLLPTTDCATDFSCQHLSALVSTCQNLLALDLVSTCEHLQEFASTSSLPLWNCCTQNFNNPAQHPRWAFLHSGAFATQLEASFSPWHASLESRACGMDELSSSPGGQSRAMVVRLPNRSERFRTFTGDYARRQASSPATRLGPSRRDGEGIQHLQKHIRSVR